MDQGSNSSSGNSASLRVLNANGSTLLRPPSGGNAGLSITAPPSDRSGNSGNDSPHIASHTPPDEGDDIDAQVAALDRVIDSKPGSGPATPERRKKKTHAPDIAYLPSTPEQGVALLLNTANFPESPSPERSPRTHASRARSSPDRALLHDAAADARERSDSTFVLDVRSLAATPASALPHGAASTPTNSTRSVSFGGAAHSGTLVVRPSLASRHPTLPHVPAGHALSPTSAFSPSSGGRGTVRSVSFAVTTATTTATASSSVVGPAIVEAWIPASASSSPRDLGHPQGQLGRVKSDPHPPRLAPRNSQDRVELESSVSALATSPDPQPDPRLPPPAEDTSLPHARVLASRRRWGWLRGCCALRLAPSAPLRFPGDEFIVQGPSKAIRQRASAALVLLSSTGGLSRSPSPLPASPSSRSAGGAGNDATLVVQVAAYDASLGSGFTDMDSPAGQSWSWVTSWTRGWMRVMFVCSLLKRFADACQLPLVACAHFADTVLDGVVAGYWAGNAAMKSNPYRVAWACTAAVAIAMPTIITVVGEALKPSVPAPAQAVGGKDKTDCEQHARSGSNRCAIQLLNIFQLRGFYEAALLCRYHRAHPDLTAPGPDDDDGVKKPSRTAESQEMHSMHITRSIFQCAPMFLLQAGALAVQYSDSTEARPPQGQWQTVTLVSLASSLLCFSMTVYRLLVVDASWREKAGVPGLILFAAMLILHPAHKALGYVILLVLCPGWVVGTVAVVSTLVTGVLLVAAELASPTRRSSVSDAAGILRTALVMGAVESVCSGVGMSDLVAATNAPRRSGMGVGCAVNWLREYWPVVAWQVIEGAIIAAVYCVYGSLWAATITWVLGAALLLRVLCLGFLVPRINV